MKGFLIILTLFIGISLQAQVYTSNSLVIVKLTDIPSDQWDQLVTKVHSATGMTTEWYCEESEILVIRYRHNLKEKADVEQFMMSKMKAWTKMKLCKILYVDMANSIQKC